MTCREVLSKTRIPGRSFFTRQAPAVARDLLGKIVVHRLGARGESPVTQKMGTAHYCPNVDS